MSNYDVHPDGRFLMIEPVEQTEERLVYIENWRAKVVATFDR